MAGPMSQWRRDLVWLILWTGLGFGAAMLGNWSEWLAQFARHYEAWQLDEWPLGLLLLALGLCWFIWRRLTELNALLKQNHELAQRLITVQEDERRHIARELHDEFGQGCTAIRLEAQCVQGLAKDAPSRQAICDSALRIDEAAHGLYDLVQSRLKQLRPQSLDGLGLFAAIQELCEQWELQAGTACAFFPPGEAAQALILQQCEDAVLVALYRMVQEALTNVARHAQASQVKVGMTMEGSPAVLKLEVQDDGVGLTRSKTGFGLLGMQERASALGGDLTLLTPKDTQTGCLVRVVLPLRWGRA